jgi:hypothetical protein
MNLVELKENAKKVLSLEPSENYEHISFATVSGGSPTNRTELPEVHRADKKKYNTTRNGWAYAGELVLEARKLDGVLDKNDREVYEHVSGELFVYKYSSGSAAHFDFGAIDTPD